MFEVYTGSRPGRPTVLLLLAAGGLVTALGLAWAQVQRTRALGEAVLLEGTPLVVRAPEGWIRDAKNPLLFGKLIRKQIWGREIWEAERTVEFHYNEFSKQFLRLFQIASAYPSEPARIGEWEGVQYVVDRNTPRMPGQMAFRWVTTPGGRQIGVEYTPLAEFSHGDSYLLDEICQAVQVDDTNSRPTPAALLARAGLGFPINDEWEILGPDHQDGPGFWVQEVEDHRPVWAIGVFRRVGAIDPERLLRLEARQLHLGASLQGGSREDGTFVGVVRQPDAVRGAGVITSLWVVSRPPTETAVLYVLAGPGYTGRANGAAEQLVATMEFTADVSD
jgi:hypothetical protein